MLLRIFARQACLLLIAALLCQLASPATAQVALAEHCKRASDVAQSVIRRLGPDTFSAELRRGLDAWLANGAGCTGVLQVHVRQYRDVAAFNLIRSWLTGGPANLDQVVLHVDEPGADGPTAQTLPTGRGSIGELLQQKRQLGAAEYETTPLQVWRVSFDAYTRLLREGFTPTNILHAAEDYFVFGRGAPPYDELRSRAVLDRDDGGRRDQRNCLLRRTGIASALDVETHRLGALYRAATAEAEKAQLLKQIDRRGEAIQASVRCQPSDLSSAPQAATWEACLAAVPDAERRFLPDLSADTRAAYGRLKRDLGPMIAHSHACSAVGWTEVGWLERKQKAAQARQAFTEPQPPEPKGTIYCRCNAAFPVAGSDAARATAVRPPGARPLLDETMTKADCLRIVQSVIRDYSLQGAELGDAFVEGLEKWVSSGCRTPPVSPARTHGEKAALRSLSDRLPIWQDGIAACETIADTNRRRSCWDERIRNGPSSGSR